MIGEAEIRTMRRGSFLINASRGRVVDIDALAAALRDGHLLGAAVDVFPAEPADARRALPLALARPAQRHPHPAHRRLDRRGAGPDRQRGRAQADRLFRHRLHLRRGELPSGAAPRPARAAPASCTSTATCRACWRSHRRICPRAVLNIGAQYLQTDGEIGYVVVDVDGGAEEEQEILSPICERIEGTIRARFLYERS